MFAAEETCPSVCVVIEKRIMWHSNEAVRVSLLLILFQFLLCRPGRSHKLIETVKIDAQVRESAA